MCSHTNTNIHALTCNISISVLSYSLQPWELDTNLLLRRHHGRTAGFGMTKRFLSLHASPWKTLKSNIKFELFLPLPLGYNITITIRILKLLKVKGKDNRKLILLRD